MTDDDLVTRAKAGDPDAWRALYRQHAGRLVVWLHTRPTGDSATSPDDVAAEAWYVAAAKISEFDGTASDFGGWLFTIARKIGASTRRTTDRRATRPGGAAEHLDAVRRGPVPSHGAGDPDAHVVGTDWVRDVVAGLPPRERDAVGLVDGLGMDQTTAAEVLGVSTVALRVARHRGLRRLHRRMTPDAGPGTTTGTTTTGTTTTGTTTTTTVGPKKSVGDVTPEA